MMSCDHLILHRMYYVLSLSMLVRLVVAVLFATRMHTCAAIHLTYKILVLA